MKFNPFLPSNLHIVHVQSVISVPTSPPAAEVAMHYIVDIVEFKVYVMKSSAQAARQSDRQRYLRVPVSPSSRMM
jgi:hypothetical protein